MIKKCFALILALIFMLSMGACTKEEASSAPNAEELEVIREEIRPIAEKFILDMLSSNWVEVDKVAAVNFETFASQKLCEKNNNSGIWYKGGTFTVDDTTYKSLVELLEAWSGDSGELLEKNIEFLNFMYFPAEKTNEAIENLSIQDIGLLPLDDVKAECAASLEFNVYAKIHYDDPIEGTDKTYSYDDENAGTITVFMLKIDGKWKVYSPSFTGMIFGLGYFK